MSATREELQLKHFLTLVSAGKQLLHKREYRRAQSSFTAILDLKPEDKECLIGRSNCYLNTGQLQNALKDAELSLKSDKAFPEGVYQKAKALFYMGEFEFSLVFYHRGQRIRSQMQCFTLGIKKAQEAIKNAVGEPSRVKLKIGGDLSFLENEEARLRPISVVENLMEEEKIDAPKPLRNDKTTKHLTGDFHDLKKFLEDAIKDEDLMKEKTKSGEQVQEIIQGCLTSIETYIEICNQENIAAPQEKKPQEVRTPTASKFEEFPLRTLREIDAEEGLKKAKGALKFVQRRSKTEFPQKKLLLGSLHGSIGNALLYRGELDKALEHHQAELELAEQCKLPEAKSRALDNLGQTYAQRGDFAEAIEMWKKRIPLIHSGLEKVWLFHEIGCFYLKLLQYEEAKEYAVLSVAEAAEVPDVKWKMNANVLMAQSELKLGNFQSSVSHFETALVQARQQDDESALNAIQKALEEAKQHIRK
ncbi:tetratricopeptide repeat protein 25 isoform X2 [Oryzias melastigma]|uniref:tetratricopeptide repeat protein 25 isoform X2 n=1 Tax=Oryzias melastigma TaxID=30732 RepID=UPI000CF837BF|nr:tetratricopeptide repeat protein 25 isoform X2 [Oryzias melastigma]